eukprot:6180605-Pleurochrysis_carterae.AAC.1
MTVRIKKALGPLDPLGVLLLIVVHIDDGPEGRPHRHDLGRNHGKLKVVGFSEEVTNRNLEGNELESVGRAGKSHERAWAFQADGLKKDYKG